MKILVISTKELGFNGISSYILNYYAYIKYERCQIDLAVPNRINCRLKKELDGRLTSVYELTTQNKHSFFYFFQLKKIIYENKYDIVHAYGDDCTLAIEMLAAFLGGCKIRIAHSHAKGDIAKKTHTLLRKLFDLLCTNSFACDMRGGKQLFLEKSFTIINHGIIAEKFLYNEAIRKKLRSRMGIVDKFVIGHVGLFKEQKNHKALISIFHQVHQKNQNAILLLIGDGALENELRMLVKQLKLEKYVIFYGESNHVNELMQVMDVFVFPSSKEGFGMTLLEAQTAGLFCFVSNHISDTAKITEYFKKLSLNDINKWADEILAFSENTLIDRLMEREKTKKQVISYNYDSSNLAKNLFLLYKNLLIKSIL